VIGERGLGGRERGNKRMSERERERETWSELFAVMLGTSPRVEGGNKTNGNARADNSLRSVCRKSTTRVFSPNRLPRIDSTRIIDR
jgi:hypothetical protein